MVYMQLYFHLMSSTVAFHFDVHVCVNILVIICFVSCSFFVYCSWLVKFRILRAYAMYTCGQAFQYMSYCGHPVSVNIPVKNCLVNSVAATIVVRSTWNLVRLKHNLLQTLGETSNMGYVSSKLSHYMALCGNEAFWTLKYMFNLIIGFVRQ